MDQPEHRFLALLGVWFEQTPDYLAFAGALESLKRDIFGPHLDKPVILHRSDILAHPMKSWMLTQAGKITWAASPFAERLLSWPSPG